MAGKDARCINVKQCLLIQSHYCIGHSLMYMSSLLYMLERFEKVHGIRARIFSAEYRYCPEVNWPVFREDCEQAYRYLMHELQIDASKVIIGELLHRYGILLLSLVHLYRW